MKKLNPPALLDPREKGAKHVHIVIPDSGQLLAHIAGQVAFDVKGELIGAGDVGKQAEQCFVNIRDCLTAIDAGPDDIVKLTMFVVDYTPAHFGLIDGAMHAVFGDKQPATAATMVGCAALAFPEFLIEIDAVVAVPADSRI